jgi:hypothetical protein
MSRITLSTLNDQIYMVNRLLDRPVQQFESEPGQPLVFAVGHICLERDSNGYTVAETTGVGGCVNVIASALSAAEAWHLLRGMMWAIKLTPKSVPN